MKLKRNITSEIKGHKVLFAVYATLRTFVVLALAWSLIRGNYQNAFTCALTLVLFLMPMFVEKNFGIEIPTALEIVILCFVFAAEILGELQCYYVRFHGWDTMLHTVNGFLCAAVGFSLIDIFNRNERFTFKMSPLFLAIVAFCFSMTIGVLWEFFECLSDLLMHTDMQKDYVIHNIYSVSLDATNSNIPIGVNNITDTVVNGESLGVGGYLDIGLLDTMKDLAVNFVGAVIFSIIGYFYVKTNGKGRIAKSFIPVVKISADALTTDEK